MSTAAAPAAITADLIRANLVALRDAGHVRLDDEEIEALALALDGLEAATVSLFGSRADPLARGGDVDVLVLGGLPAFETSRRVATRFFGRCEEKVDVVVIDPLRATPAEAEFLARLRSVRVA